MGGGKSYDGFLSIVFFVFVLLLFFCFKYMYFSRTLCHREVQSTSLADHERPMTGQVSYFVPFRFLCFARFLFRFCFVALFSGDGAVQTACLNTVPV